jgi:pilus assembly protein CpaE
LRKGGEAVTAVPSLLVVTSDRKLHDEIATALAGLSDHTAVLNSASDMRQGLQMARNRAPDLVVVELGEDGSSLRAFTQETKAAVPDTTIAAVFNPETLGVNGSESSTLISALRVGVTDFLRRPVSASELEQLLSRTRQHSARRPAALGTVTSFISNKGGVGKTTVSVNASCALGMRHPGRVLLVDASLQLGMAASMLDLTPAATLSDAVRERERLDVTLIRQLATPHDCGLHVLAGPEDAVEAAEVDEELISRVITLAQRAYDFVIVDTFPMLDCVIVAILDFSDRAYLVTENVVPVLLGAGKLIKVLDGLGVQGDRQRLVINRYQSLRGSPTLEVVADRLGTSIDYVLPYDKRLIMAANAGRPPVLSHNPFDRFTRALKPLVDDLESLRRRRVAEQEGSGYTNGHRRPHPMLAGAGAGVNEEVA